METRILKKGKRRRFNRRFRRKMIAFAVICTFLTFVNWMITPGSWWVLWVVAGWGLDLLLNALYYFADCDEECNPEN